MIIETTEIYLQESCAAMARAIQSEWISLQRITWDTGVALAGMEKMVRKNFCIVFSLERKHSSRPS